ncbi:MAG: hypothetical protein ACYTEO_10525 [Planctomycetota bacterium]|jgi:Tfp pilus assembly PilM family ATPase
MNLSWQRSFKLEREHNEPFGLDIGSSEVKLIRMRKDDTGYKVTAAGIVNIATKRAKIAGK